jgi:FtsH-binding integral membrane protein
MNEKIRKQSGNFGVVFGIVYLFSVLIGFNTILGGVLLKPFGYKASSTQPGIPEVIAFIVLMGLWAGVTAARSARERSAGTRLLASGLTGLILGVFAAAMIGLFQIFLTNKSTHAIILSCSLSPLCAPAPLNYLPWQGWLPTWGALSLLQ